MEPPENPVRFSPAASDLILAGSGGAGPGDRRRISGVTLPVDRVRRHGVAPAENRNGRGSLPGDGHGLAGVSAVAWGSTADLFDAGAALSLERSDVETDAGGVGKAA